MKIGIVMSTNEPEVVWNAFRLVDLEGLSQEEAGEKMGVSRGTVWRLIQSVRKKTAQALTEGRQIRISSSISEDIPSTLRGESKN